MGHFVNHRVLLKDEAAARTVRQCGETLQDFCHGLAVRANGQAPGEAVARVHLDLSKALEAVPAGRKAAEARLADVVIGVFDIAGAWGLDLGGAIVEQLQHQGRGR